jgi:hypothetical protein
MLSKANNNKKELPETIHVSSLLNPISAVGVKMLTAVEIKLRKY